MELPKVLGNFWEEPGQAGNFPEVSKSGRQGATRGGLWPSSAAPRIPTASGTGDGVLKDLRAPRPAIREACPEEARASAAGGGRGPGLAYRAGAGAGQSRQGQPRGRSGAHRRRRAGD